MSAVFQWVGIVVTSLGGGGLLVFLLSGYLGKIWADRIMRSEVARHSADLEKLKSNFLKDAESYKIQLKKSEFIFQKQFEAASAFTAMFMTMQPKYRWPDMEWHEACEEVVSRYGEIEIKIDEFMGAHSAILSKEVKDEIADCGAIAAQDKFGDPELPEGRFHQSTINRVTEFQEKMLEIEQKLCDLVHSQASL